MTPSTDQQEKVDALVAELRAAAEKATRGEWMFTNGNVLDAAACRVASVSIARRGSDEFDANGAFIALANPANILTLLTAFAAEREENERLKVELNKSWLEWFCHAAVLSKALPNTGEQSQ